jgi:short-subunit dehydrogenase
VNLAGREALVTGATGGLGHAIARALAARGARLVLSGRRTEALESLASELGARAVACDLADPAAVDRLITEAGAIDVLVANAGIPASGRIDRFSVEDLDRALAVNLRAPMVLAKRLAEGMAARGGGHIVFMSSMAGKAASPGGSLYSATKFGLRGFSQGLREDLRPMGIGVSSVFPSFIRDAGMYHDSGVRLPGYVATRTPEEVAAAVVRAIERDRAEVDVAPLSLRAGAAAAGLLPEVAAAVQRRLGARELGDSFADGQRWRSGEENDR